ncbi:hypothetical protein [Salinibacter ruber]|uniref:Uncharacterized protein n=1 Tax=Salinibacter ruber TaxID=146919 RepID=A0A9X2V6P0_9BACT|nr:hypothetical protein [Salinibacter ruber]MCS4121951.1 hypothetical protein [Salinibacter ruber]
MIVYLARKYLANSLVFAAAFGLLPVLFGGSLTATLVPALFWGSAAAAGYTYWRFRKKQVWPLYDNLRLPPVILLGALFLAVQPLTLALAVYL